MYDEDWFKEYQKNVDSNAKWRSRKEQKALNDKWDKSDMTQTDKEKIKDVLGYIDHLKTATEADRNDFLNVGAGAQANLLTNMIKELEKIKEKLES
jgi:hypothetical protein